MESVWAIVVTYNRRTLLEECLSALAAQERAPDHVLVIDNASTDGTRDMVSETFPWIELRTLTENEGGAGGFHEGLKAAHAAGAEWMWLMDDDTIPRPDSLARLLAARGRAPREAPLLLASKVIWSDGRPHPMNVPGRRRERLTRRLVPHDNGLMLLRYSTFVSLLVHRDAIDRYGLPLKHYFIWSDDIEFTARILRREPAGYLVPDSIVIHKTEAPYTAVSTTGDRFYFHIRNHVLMLRGTSWSWWEKLGLIYKMLRTSLSYMRINHWRSRHLRIIARGLCDGVRSVPPLP